VKSKPFKLVPGLIALAVILFVCLLRLLRLPLAIGLAFDRDDLG